MNPLPFLIDFDGVLNLGNKPAPYISEFLNFIKDKNIPAFVISNSTLKTSDDIKEFFKSFNIEFDIPAMTASEAAFKYAAEKYKQVKVYCIEKIKNLFADLVVKENPEAVIVGDLGEGWSYNILNEIFREVMSGADLIAMHKNKYWMPDGKNLSLDAGSFVKAIEFAAGKEALLIGKPSPIYFKTALAELSKKFNLENSEVNSFYMLGDDLESDIYAAKNIGGKGILIYTGKTKFLLPDNLDIKPDYEVMNLKEVIELMKLIYK